MQHIDFHHIVRCVDVVRVHCDKLVESFGEYIDYCYYLGLEHDYIYL